MATWQGSTRPSLAADRHILSVKMLTLYPPSEKGGGAYRNIDIFEPIAANMVSDGASLKASFQTNLSATLRHRSSCPPITSRGLSPNSLAAVLKMV
jgi:hypothetical protein